jgi:Indolepyruvate ferredoxin oxidoreductase, alpha and beta subunits
MTLISGIQALLAAASACRVHSIFSVPGFPITDVVNAFLDSDEFSESTKWFSNEKIAFEWGLGASFSGKRAVVAVKHVGMNVLADPLMTAGIHTIGGGLVILAGDDPEVSGSQNSQDSRYYGGLSRSPVFDPATPQEIYDYLE